MAASRSRGLFPHNTDAYVHPNRTSGGWHVIDKQEHAQHMVARWKKRNANQNGGSNREVSNDQMGRLLLRDQEA